MAKKIPKGQINKVKANFGNLSKVIQKLDKKISIRVGILGKEATAKHPGSDLTNAALGAVHEFGATIKIPPRDISVYRSIDKDGNFKYGGRFRKKTAASVNWQEDYHLSETEVVIPTRSFLRMPLLSPEGKKALQVWSVKDKEALIEYLNNDNVSAVVLANVIGAKALERVHKAFETDGFGNWKPITQASRNRRVGDPNNPTLVDTGDLKSSITFEVKTLN